MKLRNINIALRASIFFAFIVVLVFVLGVIAVIQMGKLLDSEKDVETNWMQSIRQTALIDAGRMKLQLEILRVLNDPESIKGLSLKFAESKKGFTGAVKKYEEFVASDQERALYLKVRAGADAYSGQVDLVESMISAGDVDSIKRLVKTTLRPLGDTLEGQTLDLADFNNKGAVLAGKYATSTYSTGLWLVIAIIAGTVILTLVFATLLTRSITSPINYALSVAERIAGSDLSTEVSINGTDEAGRLLKALAKMQENLRNTIMKIADSAAQLASAAEEMTAVTEESSRGLISQNDEVNQAATAVTEMSAAVDEVARNAESASEESQKGRGFTTSGLERVALTLSSIQQLSGNVTDTGEQIKLLSDKAQGISKVVDVIRAIADQTNLLALNAAIEAARAGEQGRGFAVVADEVRALAHRTQQSTQEIEQMIAVIQIDSEKAVSAMSTSTELANKSLDVAQEASTSLDQIAQAITLINERNLLIATASEEQAHVAREVDRNLVSIRGLATQSSAGAAQTASACGEMSTLAINLNQLVGRFVV
ncbi:chemotaxis protein [Pseudomonas syringae]|uniref:Chemotaxis protein n=1 Tax=Pseudomonas syringae TaxID=317 RepID=A0A1C7YVJ2_PSESX|nr:methyl-accepting chemotaxis protein [Pseudomonas syringae]OCR21691.1 chemotaxis protein [Pseudomonas syringae]